MQAAASPTTSDFVKVALPSVIGIIGMFITYHLGKKAKTDDIRIKRGYELAEQIAVLFQDIHEIYITLDQLVTRNFGHVDFSDAIESFHRYSSLYEQDRDRISSLMEKRVQLAALIKSARVYLSPDLLDKLQAYIQRGEFVYTTDGGIFTDTYIEDFFRNLRDSSNRSRREQLYKEVLSSLHKPVR